MGTRFFRFTLHKLPDSLHQLPLALAVSSRITVERQGGAAVPHQLHRFPHTAPGCPYQCDERMPQAVKVHAAVEVLPLDARLIEEFIQPAGDV